MMEKNVGQIDKIVRVILGVVFAVLLIYFALQNTGTVDLVLALIFAILALIMFVTAIMGTCPIWSVLKVNTNKT